jgi:hypothetical protein
VNAPILGSGQKRARIDFSAPVSSTSAFDLVVRNARVATASDTFDADIGISALRSRPATKRSTLQVGW